MDRVAMLPTNMPMNSDRAIQPPALMPPSCDEHSQAGYSTAEIYKPPQKVTKCRVDALMIDMASKPASAIQAQYPPAAGAASCHAPDGVRPWLIWLLFVRF
jgi:hypothetical protein